MLALRASAYENAPLPAASFLSERPTWRLHSWGSQIDLEEGFEMALALSQPSTSWSSVHPWDSEACSAASSTLSEHLMLSTSNSEDLDVLSIEVSDLGYSPAHSPQYGSTRSEWRLSLMPW